MQNTPFLNSHQKDTCGNILLVFLVGCITFAAVVGYFAYNSTLDSTSPVVVDDVQEKEEKKLLAKMDQMLSLYEAESVPVVSNNVPAGADPMNYGLNEGVPPSVLSGLYMLSGVMRPHSDQLQVFSLDVSSSTAQPVVYQPDYTFSGMAEFDNPNDPSGFFFLDEFSDGPAGISYLDAVSNEVVTYEDTQDKSNRNLAWSEPAGLLAYDRYRRDVEADNLNQMIHTNREIVIFDPKEQQVVSVVTAASQPEWLPDGKSFMFLKHDGLYLYEVESEQEISLLKVPEGGVVIGTSMIEVSQDGKYLVWTTAKRGVITMFEIGADDESDVVLNELGRISLPDTEVYHPVFSPDGNYYTVQAIDTLKPGDQVRQNARIEVRPTTGREVVYTYALDQFPFNALFADDWIVSPE